MYRALSVSLLITQIFIVSLLLWVVNLYRHSISAGCEYKKPRISIKGIANIPVEMEMRQFHTAVRYGDVTPFMGGWNNETNHAWESILDGQRLQCDYFDISRLTFSSWPHQTHSRSSIKDGAQNSKKPTRFLHLCWRPRSISPTSLPSRLISALHSLALHKLCINHLRTTFVMGTTSRRKEIFTQIPEKMQHTQVMTSATHMYCICNNRPHRSLFRLSPPKSHVLVGYGYCVD